MQKLLARDLPPGATIVDVGAGTGLFTFAFAEGLPEASVYALEVRTDALQYLNEKVRTEGSAASNVTIMRMEEGKVPKLPDGKKADLVFVCDVLDFVPADKKEHYLLTLRSMPRDAWEGLQ